MRLKKWKSDIFRLKEHMKEPKKFPYWSVRLCPLENCPYYSVWPLENGPYYAVRMCPIENCPYYYVCPLENGPYYYVCPLENGPYYSVRMCPLVDCPYYSVCPSKIASTILCAPSRMARTILPVSAPSPCGGCQYVKRRQVISRISYFSRRVVKLAGSRDTSRGAADNQSLSFLLLFNGGGRVLVLF